MVDLYTKSILTVIAAALVVLVLQNSLGPASAQLGLGSCGDTVNTACYVQNTSRDPLFVINR